MGMRKTRMPICHEVPLANSVGPSMQKHRRNHCRNVLVALTLILAATANIAARADAHRPDRMPSSQSDTPMDTGPGMRPGHHGTRGSAWITVTGEGRVSRDPNRAEIVIAVSKQADRASAAMRENARTVRAVIDALEAAGIAASDRRTTTLQLFPLHAQTPNPNSGDENRVVGYRSENGLHVTLRDPDRLGAVLDAAIAAGANRISRIHFSLDDPTAVDAARRAAFADARRQAILYAQVAGGSLGSVLAVREGPPLDRPFMAANADLAAARFETSTPIEEGLITVARRVTVVFSLKNKPPNDDIDK